MLAVEQLDLYDRGTAPALPPAPQAARVCAGCRLAEARYGFREGGRHNRPRTLCFACFRMELTRRQRAAERMARGWNARQTALPLDRILADTARRRRRAQIAARHALAEGE
ncbi:MAG: hypothetical protein FJW23_00965 [Acidimicrobiia bacterium]|nr:hypothetical protein [Acidimicrobiia bacterium]